MQCNEVRVALLDDECAEGKPESDVIEGIRLFVRWARKDCGGNGEFEGRGHSCNLI